jgi:hypothetical protein
MGMGGSYPRDVALDHRSRSSGQIGSDAFPFSMAAEPAADLILVVRAKFEK